MPAQRPAVLVMLAVLAVTLVGGCSSEVASQAREICIDAAYADGGGSGEAEVRTTRGWDDPDGTITVEGDWTVDQGEEVLTPGGARAEWRTGFLYPWTCTVDAGKVSGFVFAWGPQEIAGPLPVEGTADDTPTSLVKDDACNIKGNIAFDSGEKIYHVPGQEYYGATKINEAYGERWFCTEQEALGAGWRKSQL